MNRHLGPFPLALLGGILILTATISSVRGQATAPVGNIDSIKGLQSVAASIPQITAWINQHVQTMTSGDATAAARARDELIEAASPGRVNPTVSFLAEFPRLLDAGIAPALKHDSDLVRLNAAIAVAKAAERTDNAALGGATLTLLNDKSHFVALWGIKSARWVIPAVLRNPLGNADNLMTAVIKAVATHGVGAIGSAVVADAYDALTVDVFDNNAKRRPSDKTLTTVIPFMHQLLQQRAALYRSGIPPEPLAEQKGTLFLVNNRVWSLHTPAQKLAAMQIMSDLTGLAAQHVGNAAPADRESLAFMIGRVAGAIAVVPETQPIHAQLAPAAKIDARTPPDQIIAAVNAIQPALKQIKQFAALNPPPALAAVAPADGGGTTQPSTAPTTAPATVPARAAAAIP